MANNMTTTALNKRAQNAAIVMTECAELLSKALADHTPPAAETRDWLRPRPQPPEKIELTSRDVQKMIEELVKYAEELKQFTWRA